MTRQIETPPYRRNPDWYRVKYRLAATLTNRAFITSEPMPRKLGYTRAQKEIDELLWACWSTLEPLPLEGLRRGSREVREFVARSAVPAALDLKALIELGLNGEPGEDQNLTLKTVARRLKKGETVTPLTIVNAVVAEKEDPSAFLMLDLACFFNQIGDKKKARDYAAKAIEKLPAADRGRLRARAASDPMLMTIPGLARVEEKRRCQWPKRASGEAERPPRPWF